jgi:hypothetical protein
MCTESSCQNDRCDPEYRSHVGPTNAKCPVESVCVTSRSSHSTTAPDECLGYLRCGLDHSTESASASHGNRATLSANVGLTRAPCFKGLSESGWGAKNPKQCRAPWIESVPCGDPAITPQRIDPAVSNTPQRSPLPNLRRCCDARTRIGVDGTRPTAMEFDRRSPLSRSVSI